MNPHTMAQHIAEHRADYNDDRDSLVCGCGDTFEASIVDDTLEIMAHAEHVATTFRSADAPAGVGPMSVPGLRSAAFTLQLLTKAGHHSLSDLDMLDRAHDIVSEALAAAEKAAAQ